MRFPKSVAVLYLAAALGVLWLAGSRLGVEIFPAVDTGQFQLRFRAPEGTRIERTEALATRMLEVIKTEAGGEGVEKTVGFVGVPTPNFPINSIFLWMGGPQEGVLRVNLKAHAGIAVSELKERLRGKLSALMPEVEFSFESGDIVNDVMSFGSPTPIEIAVSGANLAVNQSFAEKIKERLALIPSLRDLQFGQPLKYPTLDITVDRERAGFAGVSASDVARSMLAATSSSRFVIPNFWADPKTGIAYQVQVEVPQNQMDSIDALQRIPVKSLPEGQVLLRDVAQVAPGQIPGEYDRYNMRRMVTLTGNIAGADLGKVSSQISAALREAGDPPAGVNIDVRGQIAPLNQMISGLSTGMILAVAVVLLLLAAYFQSVRLAFAVISTVPAVLAGVCVGLYASGTTINVQSFMGSIMAVGVGVANAILLVTFAERSRLEQGEGGTSAEAAVNGAASRLRPILMTSAAMIAGMLPLALGVGESGEQIAPLGRAAVGGLAGATLATLLVLPAVFTIVRGRGAARSASLDPDDAESVHYEKR